MRTGPGNSWTGTRPPVAGASGRHGGTRKVTTLDSQLRSTIYGFPALGSCNAHRGEKLVMAPGSTRRYIALQLDTINHVANGSDRQTQKGTPAACLGGVTD